MKKISAIVATDINFLIGNNNKMPWYLPADLKHFKQLTTGKLIIMGRKTFESLPNGALPNRRNIILSTNKNLRLENAEVYHSINEILNIIDDNEDAFIIGGAQIYSLFMPYVSKLYLTQIKHAFSGDTFFPELDSLKWKLTEDKQHKADIKNKWDYSFKIFEKQTLN